MSEIDEMELEPLPRQSNRDERLIYQTLADSLRTATQGSGDAPD